MVYIIGKGEVTRRTPEKPECPICKEDMIKSMGKKGVVWACYRCKVALGVTDPMVLRENLKKEGTMMKRFDKVIIGQLEWEVVMVKEDNDVLLRRPNPKDRKKMDFALIEVVDFVFDKNQRKWIEVESLPEDEVFDAA